MMTLSRRNIAKHVRQHQQTIKSCQLQQVTYRWKYSSINGMSKTEWIRRHNFAISLQLINKAGSESASLLLSRSTTNYLLANAKDRTGWRLANLLAMKLPKRQRDL